MKKSLLDTNPYLRDPEQRKAMLLRSTYESSVFEGARGLKRLSAHFAGDKAERSDETKKADKAA